MSPNHFPVVVKTATYVVDFTFPKKASTLYLTSSRALKLKSKPQRIGVAGQGNLPSVPRLSAWILTPATATSSRWGFARSRSQKSRKTFPLDGRGGVGVVVGLARSRPMTTRARARRDLPGLCEGAQTDAGPALILPEGRGRAVWGSLGV
jgi:hypothetical protein